MLFWLQPENIKVPVYLHHGALDDMKGFSDPEVHAGAGVALKLLCACAAVAVC